ncbi:MAG: site-specific integrase, partial [Hydrogenoanaerobacterium sp.]
GLKWSDVNYAAKMLSISRSATCYKGEFVLSETKTKNSNRTLLMCDFVVCALKAWQAIQCQNSIGLVVTHFSGALLSSTVLNNMYHAALKAAKLPPIRFHDLRHTNATIMLQQNIPAKIVSSMLGHSSVGITLDLYSHVLTEMQRPAVCAMQNMLVRA